MDDLLIAKHILKVLISARLRKTEIDIIHEVLKSSDNLGVTREDISRVMEMTFSQLCAL